MIAYLGLASSGRAPRGEHGSIPQKLALGPILQTHEARRIFPRADQRQRLSASAPARNASRAVGLAASFPTAGKMQPCGARMCLITSPIDACPCSPLSTSWLGHGLHTLHPSLIPSIRRVVSRATLSCNSPSWVLLSLYVILTGIRSHYQQHRPLPMLAALLVPVSRGYGTVAC